MLDCFPNPCGEVFNPNDGMVVYYMDDVFPGIVGSTHRVGHFPTVGDSFISPAWVWLFHLRYLEGISYFRTNEFEIHAL